MGPSYKSKFGPRRGPTTEWLPSVPARGDHSVIASMHFCIEDAERNCIIITILRFSRPYGRKIFQNPKQNQIGNFLIYSNLINCEILNKILIILAAPHQCSSKLAHCFRLTQDFRTHACANYDTVSGGKLSCPAVSPKGWQTTGRGGAPAQPRCS